MLLLLDTPEKLTGDADDGDDVTGEGEDEAKIAAALTFTFLATQISLVVVFCLLFVVADPLIGGCWGLGTTT